MKTINDLFYLLNKIDFDRYLKSNDDEKFKKIEKILIDDINDFTSYRVKNILIGLDDFVSFVDNTNIKLSGYW